MSAQAEDLRQLREQVQPAIEGDPEMTIGEALREIKRRTDETIRWMEEQE
jgi:hypothetical protein